ncbi:MAG TPA: zinc ABC transporter permease [Thiomicrospira sp.]|nr:zinc ABC transporter permease [Thiomicrospira sp.]
MNSLAGFELIEPSFWMLFIEFWKFNDINAVWVLIGTVLLGISASVIGSFVFLRKRALMGDALAHAALPGVMIAFILFQANDPFIMFLGAVFSSFMGLFLMDWLPKNTKIKPDAAMAITLSFFFALGMMALSYIQGLEVAGKSGLDKILFGQAAAMLLADLYLLSAVALLVLTVVTIFFQKFRLITFNRIYAKSLGLNIAFYDVVLALLIVLSVVIGLQIVGVILMAALLLTPIAAAKFWSAKLPVMLFTAGAIGGISGVVSANISYVAPAMPTGPWMVVVLSVLFILSFLFAPQRGLVSNLRQQSKLRKQVREENVLRTLYVLNERDPANSSKPLRLDGSYEVEDILKSRSGSFSELQKTLSRLSKKGLLLTVANSQSAVSLSNEGQSLAIDLTRRHRLWENYLTEQADIAPENVHQQAEKIEHLLTEKQTQEIEKSLKGSGKEDPHGKNIPASRPSSQGEDK